MAQGANAIRSHLAASKYFEDQNIQGTFLELSKLLVLHQPENAQRFMYAYLGSLIGAEDTTPSVVVPDAFSDTCLLRVHASYEGPDGKRKKTFTRLVSSVDKMIRYDVEQHAAREVHSVFWPNDRLTARPLAEQLSAIHVDPTSVDVIAAVEKFLDFCHNRMYLRSQTLESLFGAWDTDQSRDLSMEEMKVVCQENAVPIQGDDHLRSIFEHLRAGRSGGIGLEQLRQTLDLHAQRRQLADLLRQSTDLAWLIARHVLPSPYDTIASLRKVGTAALCDRVSNIEPDILAAVVSVFDVVAHADQQTSEQQQCKQRIDEVEKAISDLLLELDQEPHLQQSTQDTQQPPNTAASTARPTTAPPTPLPQSVTPPTAAKPVNTAARPSDRAAAPAAACSDTLSDTDIHSPAHRTSNPVEDYNMRVSAEDKRQQQLQALKDQLAQLKVREKLSHGGGGSNDKFAALAQDTEGLVQAQFGDTNLFLNLGLVGLVGWPSADILRAMQMEHASSRKFKAGNYPGERTPSEEFEFVWDPVDDKVYPHERVGGATEGRERKRLEDLMQLPDIVASKATKEEVLALRLFTGAMYAEYNSELRNALTYYLKSRAKAIVGVFDAAKHAADEYAKSQTAADEADATANKAPSDKNLEDKARFAQAEAEKSKAAAEVADKAASNVKLDELCNVAEALGLKTKRKIQGEERKQAIVDELRKLVADLPSVRPRCLYVTTLHMANSCIIKLASVLKCPEGRKVFRGFSGMRVPEFFYKANILGFRGGVEPGFMSTSTRKSVALAYSNHGLKPIFLELEVGQVNCGADVQIISQYPHEAEITFPPLTHIEILHEGRVEEVDGRTVLVMSGKLSVNIKSLSREQLVAQRKENLLAAFGHQVFEIEQSINQKLDDCIQVKGLKETDQFVIWGREVARLLMEECEKTVQRYRDIEPEDFNTDDHVHELALQEVAALPTAAAAKFGAFLDGQSFQPGDFDVMSMDQWAALRVTTRWHNYQEEAEVKDPTVGEGGSKGPETQEEAEVKAPVVGQGDSHVPGPESQEEAEVKAVGEGGSKGPESQEEAEVKAPVVGEGDSKGPETQEHVDEGGGARQRGTSAHKWTKNTGVDGAASVIDTNMLSLNFGAPGDFGAKTGKAFGESSGFGATTGGAFGGGAFGPSTGAGFGGGAFGAAAKTAQGQYVSITHMQEYQDFSCEELRVQDYEAGRRITPEGKAQAAEAQVIWKAAEARANAEAEAKAAAEKAAVAKSATMERRREVAVRLAQARGLVSMPKGVPSSYLQQIVRERQSLDATWGAEKSTALMRAVVNTHLADVKLLLDASCNIEATDANGRTALAYCMIYGRDDMARELLARGASIQTLTKHKQSLVFLASRFGHTRVLEAVLSHEGKKFRDKYINVKTSDGNKFEFAWAQFGTRSRIAHITAVLCDPERADQELINAEQLNQKVAVAKRGGNSFVEKAQRSQQAGALALIIINTDNGLFSPGNVMAVDSAVTSPVILVTADAGATLEGSHVTLEGGGHIFCDRELLWIKDSFGESALHIAAEFGHSAVVEVLVKKGGRDFLFVKKDEETCLHVAAQEGRSAVVEVLVKEGGRDLLVCKDKNGASALYIAAQEGHLSVVELLVKECVKAGGLNRNDFELMLKKGDGKGASALSIASEEGHPAVEEALVKACEKYGLSETEINDLWRTGAKNGKQQRRSRELERVPSASKNIEISVDVASLPEITQALYDPSEQVQEEATRQFRKLLSIERNPPIQQVISAGVVPRIVEFLTKWQCPTLQFEAAWALTNISSGTSEHTKLVVEKGAVPMLVQLLNSPNDDVREQAVWALGNIAGDSAKLRDEVLNHNALMPLLRQLDPNTTRISMLRNAMWTLSNFCRGKPQPPFELVRPALPTLASLVNSNDVEVLTDACWALSYLSDGTNEKIQAVIDAGVCRRLVELLMHQSAQVKTPALRTVGNIVTGDDQQTQHLINCAVLPCLHQLLSHDRKGIRKETCWALSNITAGSKEQLQAVIDHNIIPSLVHMLETEDFDIRKECAWAISNATSGGDDLQIKFLVDNGCVPALVNLLDKPDVRIVSVGLEGIENVLKSGQRNLNGDGSNPFVAVVEMCGGVDKIEDLQRHENHKIYDLAVKILENYFGVDDDEEKP